MRKGNGKSEESIGIQNEDLKRELPAGDGGEDPGVSGARGTVDISAASEAEKLKAERDALLDRLARQQAEFDNARKRAVREQQEFRDFAAADAIKNILPVLDSFERALKAGGDGSEFRGGVELIYRQLTDALQKAGVQPISAVGQAFDPKVHEAIEMVDTNEVADHHVLDELQRGYRYKDRLLRPAMVRVARGK
jgi:molecular chaperone GrpE